MIEDEEEERPHIEEENGVEADILKENEEHPRIEAEEAEAARLQQQEEEECLRVEAENEAVRLREGEDELLFIETEENEDLIPQCELEGTGQTDAETAIEDEHQGFDSKDEIEAQAG